MPEITEIALLKCIRAVDFKVCYLQEKIDQTEDDDVKSDLGDEMLGYMKTAEILRVAYQDVLEKGANFPPYESLVKEY